MIPSRIVILDSMPLLSTGKVDRRALAALKCPDPEAPSPRMAARDSIESELVKLWENLLRRHPVGITDNFYELGGHSLLAVRLVAEVESLFGKKIDLSLLINAATIENLAEYLRNADRADCNSVVAMQPRGSKPPLYCVHGGGGHVLRFRDLAHALGTDQPFYGLRAPLFNNYSSAVTVESLAAKYLADILKVQPKGPYHFAGASFGGLVAYEMACQLKSQGEEVCLLALFDTGNPAYYRSMPRFRALKLQTLRKLKRLQYRLAEIRDVAAGEQVKLGSELFQSARTKISTWLWNAGYTASRWSHRPLPETLWDNLKLFTHAATLYQPKPYQGRVVLFKAEEQKAQYGNDIKLGWGNLAVGGVHVIHVPGDHMSLLEKPKVFVLADHLRACMEAARMEARNSECAESNNDLLFGANQMENILPLGQES
jgi:thioesterase domain-containing protein/acyl carrier protein